MPPLELHDTCPCGIARADCQYHAPKVPVPDGYASDKITDPDVIEGIIQAWALNHGLSFPHRKPNGLYKPGVLLVDFECRGTWPDLDRYELLDYLGTLLDHGKVVARIRA